MSTVARLSRSSDDDNAFVEDVMFAHNRRGRVDTSGVCDSPGGSTGAKSDASDCVVLFCKATWLYEDDEALNGLAAVLNNDLGSLSDDSSSYTSHQV